MEGSATTAVILGGENFVAVKLENKLKEQGIKVIKGDYEEIPEKSAYYFDFVGKEEVWEKLRPEQRLVVIGVNKNDKVKEWEKNLRASNLNWRIVVGENVYGEEMDESGFLGRAFAQAARNKNLVLPSLNQDFRVLEVSDFVEVILRSCFFSGTSGKILIAGGRKINSKIVAEVLVDEAKMTKTQVIQDERKCEEMDGNQIEMTKELLRWQAEVLFKEGAKATVQYFVSKADQENRRKKTENRNEKRDFIDLPKAEHSGGQARYAVEIEPNDVKDSGEVKEEKEVEIEVEEKSNPAPDPSLDTPVGQAGKEGSKEEFKLESLRKSPLPERKEIEGRNEVQEFVEEKKLNPPPAAAGTPLEKGRPKNTKKYWKWGLLVIGWVFLVVFLINFIKMTMIPKKILGAEAMIEKGKYTEAAKEIESLSKNNAWWLRKIGGGKVGTILRAEGEVIDLLNLSLNLAQNGEKISEGLFGEKDVEMKGELQKVEKNLDEAISEMGILQGRLSGQWGWLPGRFREQLTQLKDKMAVKRGEAEEIRKIVPVLPEILGLDGKRREYMVLLQNENELRPSGGFIGSYAILSFEGGKFLGFEVKDVYEADGQLKGHVEPPAEIKKYLGEAAWFMRDANWQASFPLAAKDIQWFLEKETGRKVDGVIGLNLASVKSILEVTGEIYIPDFKEKVNQSNLYEQAEYYSENKFFAGSIQKASFLGAVSKQLMEEIKSAKSGEGAKLLMAVIDLLDRNEVQLALNEAKTADVLAEAGWDGAIYEGKCNGEKCLADYLYIVESNFGVNKANYFLYRNVERQVEIGEKMVKNTLKITYENTAKNSTWPGGDYKDYMRIYVPADTVVQEVNWSENGSGQKRVVSGDDLKIGQVGGKKEIGFLVTVSVGKKINVELKYVENIDLSKLQSFSYLSYIQKQSGFGDTGMVTLISIPDNWQINAVEPVASVVSGKLLFNQKLDKDIKMGVEISR